MTRSRTRSLALVLSALLLPVLPADAAVASAGRSRPGRRPAATAITLTGHGFGHGNGPLAVRRPGCGARRG